ncbi:MAG: hypothetical protein R3B72_36815 [Polyangiaceae bacterium]
MTNTERVHWYPSGQVESEETYVDGRLHGPSIRYREDGSVSTRIDYLEGVPLPSSTSEERRRLSQ